MDSPHPVLFFIFYDGIILLLFIYIQYLFIWLCWVIVATLRIFALTCGFFFFSRGTQALEHLGSVVEMSGLSGCGTWAW